MVDFALFKVSIDKDKCINCRLCEKTVRWI
ncbi:4Fe-4S binding protein [Methanocaldococcus sp. 10A]